MRWGYGPVSAGAPLLIGVSATYGSLYNPCMGKQVHRANRKLATWLALERHLEGQRFGCVTLCFYSCLSCMLRMTGIAPC